MNTKSGLLPLHRVPAVIDGRARCDTRRCITDPTTSRAFQQEACDLVHVTFMQDTDNDFSRGTEHPCSPMS